jgi:predicted MPP superfamily phosphohydrolase
VALPCFYAVEIEPAWIEVTHFHVDAPVHPAIKIAHLTDLHTRQLGRPERKLLELLEQEKPDLIVITGDMTNNDGTLEETRFVLDRLHAPLGVWAVRGNWEIWQQRDDFSQFFRAHGLHYLQNESAPVRQGLWMVGLDDPRAGRPNIDAAFRGVPPGVYTITLAHAPIVFDELVGHTNLVLSGHTHGGQIRLPFLPPLWLPPGCGGYVEGWYRHAATRMYVSRGIGMSILPARFFSRPELTIITLGN